ncbi:4-hydroxy-3-methylbut-2-en-1-yl diphosphate synthase [Cypionkella aquatica]|uniref:4-hydroxy-3-methylbut-2-en-1-yl diphosphate synthase n=1 Tax=Cypionkella aquatica TaxID=1756042 RepID=A0AA37X2L2_9RHOB|nr:helix-turn-helix domain-containing protein [Cypionkella aquatica]GLS87665.1 4-hydroxy-3-methylbut-2-en-1-yl diphosphate synthase [Cypionkella aquatica]
MIGRRVKTPAAELDKPKGFDDFELRLGDLMRGERATLGKSLLDIQRELKIKATYIAAIENADVTAFETPGFIAGNVRSYARYLGMDPDWAFAKFCREAGFEVAHGMSAAASSVSMTALRARQVAQEGREGFGEINSAFMPRSESLFARVEPGAIGSLAVLVALIGALGYGGWSVLQEVQRVQLAPVEQAPVVVAELDPLAGVKAAPEPDQMADAEADISGGSDQLDRLYQREALDAPVLTARDGPIGTINPRSAGGVLTADAGAAAVPADPMQQAIDDTVQVVAAAKPGVEVLAVRPSWVRVSAADGTVLFEKILDAGERYAVPPLQQAAVLRSGNSGSIYFVVNGTTYGPAAPGAQVIKNVALSADALTTGYQTADLTGDADLAQFINVADAGLPAAPAVPSE